MWLGAAGRLPPCTSLHYPTTPLSKLVHVGVRKRLLHTDRHHRRAESSKYQKVRALSRDADRRRLHNSKPSYPFWTQNHYCDTVSMLLLHQVSTNNQTFTDPMQISECLNRYFCTIGNNLAHSLPYTDTQSFKKFLPKSNK